MRKVSTEKKGNAVVLNVEGDIEFDDSIQLNETFNNIIKKESPKIVLNLKECNYIDSSGLGSLVEGLKATQKANGDLRLANLNEDFKEILMMTRIIKYFQIFDNVDDAVKSFN
ncbi:MAG: STAS domain-containing protein [Candidatus Margulisbacteria bacterium]|nr:STAS domain-containing protein [Candidatus Margulisiibacteriota bacterium]